MHKKAKIYVAGHTGLVGSALMRKLKAEGYAGLITRPHAELDLTRQAAVESFFKKVRPDYVFLAAAKVGGIVANDTYPAEFIRTNLIIQTQVIQEAWKCGVKRMLFLGSSCIYPRMCPQPIKEEYLLSGPLESTNRAYAVAKIAGVEMCHAYNRQYGTRFVAAMPTNLYGPGDNFDLESSHVLPALIRKFHLGKMAEQGDWNAIFADARQYGKITDDVMCNLVSVSRACGNRVPDRVISECGGADGALQRRAGITLWGTGQPKREFLHVDDMADACISVMNVEDRVLDPILHCDTGPLLNIGCGKDVTIRELALLIKGIVGFKGDIIFDASKPDGTPRKLLDVSKVKKLGWQSSIALGEGIRQTYAQYLKVF